jgi:hypothetical protein
MTRQCGDCEFFARFDDEAGECRRRAPSPTVYQQDSFARWPFVNTDDWCGDFKEKQGDG